MLQLRAYFDVPRDTKREWARNEFTCENHCANVGAEVDKVKHPNEGLKRQPLFESADTPL